MKPKTFPKWIIMMFFIIGMISAVCFRSLIVFNYYYVNMRRTVWYIGVIGYIFFFGYRFYVSHKRRKVILESSLIESLETDILNDEKKEEIKYILSSIIKSKEMFNYIFIFVLSGLAILIDLILYYISNS